MTLSDSDATWLTLYGEGRGEAIETRVGIGCAIRNRVQHPGWWGKTYADVCLAPLQFSCWNESDPNRPLLDSLANRLVPYDAIARECQWLADGMIGGLVLDRVHGATHYHDLSVGHRPPAWTIGARLVCRLGRLLFYAGVQ